VVTAATALDVEGTMEAMDLAVEAIKEATEGEVGTGAMIRISTYSHGKVVCALYNKRD
jgi:20S proteasome alpha/beta subunit